MQFLVHLKFFLVTSKTKYLDVQVKSRLKSQVPNVKSQASHKQVLSQLGQVSSQVSNL